MAVDQFFFFLGVVLISQKLFADTVPVFFYSIAASVLVLVVDNQIFWNFRLFQLLPLAVFFLILADEQSRIIFATIAVLTVIVFSFGNLAYTLPFQAYTMMFFFISLMVLQNELREKIVSYLRSAVELTNILAAAAAATSLGVIVWFSVEVQSRFAYVGPGREHGLRTDITEYLTWGKLYRLSKLVELATAQPINDGMDFTGFFGSVGLVLLIYAALVEKSPIFRSLLIVLLWVIGFSVAASGVARVAYYLPGMEYFRHIGYVIGAIKWIAIIGAAFGLMRLLRVLFIRCAY